MSEKYNVNKKYNEQISKYRIRSFILLIIIQLGLLLPPYIYRNIINEQVPSDDIKSILLSTLIMVLIPFIIMIIQTLFNYISIKFSRKLGNEISIEIFNNVIKQPISFF